MAESTTVFMFPGQGSQYECMGECFLNRNQKVRDIWEMASGVFGEDLIELCMKKPLREMKRTDRAQMLIGTFSLSLVQLLKEREIIPDMVIGHSAGEIAALNAAGIVDMLTALELMAARGRFMNEDAQRFQGKMLAVMNLDLPALEDSIAPLKACGHIAIANYNAPDQFVVSGDMDIVTELEQILSRMPGVRTEDLRQQGAWHSPHMAEAQKRFEKIVNDALFSTPQVPMMFVNSGQCHSRVADIKKEIVEVITGTVKWADVMSRLAAQRNITFVEVGPNKILRGLVRRCYQNFGKKDYDVFTIDTVEQLDRYMDRYATSAAMLRNKTGEIP